MQHLDTLSPKHTSRRHTTHAQAHHLAQFPLGADLGRRSWVHRALTIRVAESRRDRAEVASIIRTRPYLRSWPCRPKTLLLSYIGSLGGTGAAAMVMIGMMPTNLGGLLSALEVHQAEVIQLLRCWRADDLDVATSPDLMPLMIRKVVRRLPADWTERKCQNLQARPRLLTSFCDTAMSHDGQLYVGAGATGLGGRNKLLFVWPLTEGLHAPLRSYAARARA